MNEESLKIKLGLKIRQYRINLNLTQEIFSEKIGITQRQMSLIELGKSFPSIKTLINISNVLNCSLGDLFNLEPCENIKNIKKELLNSINNLPDEKLKILYAVFKNI